MSRQSSSVHRTPLGGNRLGVSLTGSVIGSTLRYGFWKNRRIVQGYIVSPGATLRKSPTFGEAVADWFRAVNGPEHSRKVSLNALSDRSGVARTTLYRIEAGEGADEDTLIAIADALGAGRPVVTKALQLEPGTLQEPREPLDWIVEAQAALERAAGLLRTSATGAPVVEAEQAGEDVRPALDTPTSTDVA